MTSVWIVLVEDRHTDIEALPFSAEVRALEAARARVPPHAREAGLTPAMISDGWVLLLEYGTEGDRVRVIKRELDGK